MTDHLKGSKLSRLMAGRERPVRRFTVEVVRESGPESLALAVRTLSAHEQEQAHAEAIKWLVGTGGWQREDLIGDAGDAVLNLEVMVQILARALVDPDRTDAPFAADAAELRRCFDEYTAHALERSPFRHMKTLAEVREVADALGKGLTPLTSFPRVAAPTLRAIITSLVERAPRWTTPNSSPTTPPIDSPADSSPTSTATTPRAMTLDDSETP